MTEETKEAFESSRKTSEPANPQVDTPEGQGDEEKDRFHPSVQEAHEELSGGVPESKMRPKRPQGIKEPIQIETPQNNKA